jgi:hypothetical protein
VKFSDTFRAWLSETCNPSGQVTADGWRYLAIADGRGAPRPYHFRWLLPTLLGDDKAKWAAVSRGSVVAMVPAMRLLTGSWAPGLFVFNLDGVWGMARKYPVVVDQAAMLAAILSAAAARRRHFVTSAALALVAGSVKESSPLFAASYAWHPVPLLGLVAPLARMSVEPGEDVAQDFSHDAIERPVESAWWVRRGMAFDPKLWVAPFGALVAGFRGDRRTLATLLLAYGQTTVAVDTTRLVQWAWPVLAENTVEACGERWPLALVAHWFNPWKEAA